MCANVYVFGLALGCDRANLSSLRSINWGVLIAFGESTAE
jgi:hypothetical protein